jgi:superfamily II DNA or RNA helicase
MAEINGFQSLEIDNFYSAPGHEIVNAFVRPVLTHASSYDRLTGYFSIGALVSISQGLEELFRKNGQMRLVIGIHDVPADLIAAWKIGEILPEVVVENCRKRLLEEIGFLVSEVDKNAITTVGWMIKLGLLQVRVAAPRNENGIYHQKRMIFRDDFGNLIAGTGSLNETKGGHGNIEEMHFNFSWKSSPDMVLPLVTSFENIWNGLEKSVSIFELNEDFANEVLKTLGNPDNPLIKPKPVVVPTGIDLIGELRESPFFTPYNLSVAALYPHQERVFSESLSRWPIRVLLADEVGLGKTLEAGAIIGYLHKFASTEAISILAPAGLMSQWQEEMRMHFDLDFWRWESGSKSYVSSSGEKKFTNSYSGINAPKLRIVSSQWARANTAEIHADLPELLLVDEAHAARVNIDDYGNRKVSELWKLVDSVNDKIPHLVLMTATPMQIKVEEYHGLLTLLGLPKYWESITNYKNSLELIGKTEQKPTLNDAKILSDLLSSTLKEYQWWPSILDADENEKLVTLDSFELENHFEKSQYVLKTYPEFIKILLKLHPANFLTCRNTKSGLEEFGYKFPERNFPTYEVKMTKEHLRFQQHLEIYLTTGYGRTEEALRPSGVFPVGFARSNYYQRVVSSFYSAKKSLERREGKLKDITSLIKSGNFESLNEHFNLLIDSSDGIDDDYEILGSFALPKEELEKVIKRVNGEIQIELQMISDLLKDLDDISVDIATKDPKFILALDVLEKFSSDHPVLVFSRYTDTLEGFVKLFEDSDFSGKIPGYSVYTGNDVWIRKNGGDKVPSTKVDVTTALEDGEIKVIFCSDAASEGLNLQSARTIINLDVPWNPARLEQRIGRIARLGQKASSVDIVNLWYPNSVEATQYQRLLSRKEDYQIAVGEFPEIFGKSIRNAVISRLTSKMVTGDAMQQLVETRKHFQRVALESIWQNDKLDLSASKELREDLAAFISQIESKTSSNFGRYTSEVGVRGSITLMSKALQEAWKKANFNTSLELDNRLVIVRNDSSVLALGIIDSNKLIRLLKSNSLGKVLLCLEGTHLLSERDYATKGFLAERLKEQLGRAILQEVLVPRHDRGTFTASGAIPNAPHLALDNLVIQDVCGIKTGASLAH